MKTAKIVLFPVIALLLTGCTPVDSKTSQSNLDQSSAPSEYIAPVQSIPIERTDDPTTTRDASTGDLDCTDFSDQAEAQQAFEDAGGPDEDPYNLDRDGDGIACESL